MRTIEEIRTALICKTYTIEEFIIKLDELIETVATLQREKCAEEAKLLKSSNTVDSKVFVMKSCWVEIDKESILNAKL